MVGVIQVSRKGSNVLDAGPDFTADDLGKVLALCRPLRKLVWHGVGNQGTAGEEGGGYEEAQMSLSVESDSGRIGFGRRG